jgi:hypothetical protein
MPPPPLDVVGMFPVDIILIFIKCRDAREKKFVNDILENAQLFPAGPSERVASDKYSGKKS